MKKIINSYEHLLKAAKNYSQLVINPSIEKADNVFATNSRGTVIQSFQYSQRKCKIIGFHFVGHSHKNKPRKTKTCLQDHKVYVIIRLLLKIVSKY